MSFTGIVGWIACAASQQQGAVPASSEVLSGVEVDQEGGTTIVTLLGVVDPVYKASLDEETATLVVDLIGIESGESGTPEGWDTDANQTLVYDGVVNHVTVSSFRGEGGDSSTRVEVALAEPYAYEVESVGGALTLRILGSGVIVDKTASLDEGELLGDLGEEEDLGGIDDSLWTEEPVREVQLAPMTPATRLLAVDHALSEGGILLHLRADGVVEQSEAFVLEGPDRLVIDLPGLENGIEKEMLYIDSNSVSQVRLGAHPGKVRVVIDGGEASAGFGRRSMTPVADGLWVSLGSGEVLDAALAQAVTNSNKILEIPVQPSDFGGTASTDDAFLDDTWNPSAGSDSQSGVAAWDDEVSSASSEEELDELVAEIDELGSQADSIDEALYGSGKVEFGLGQEEAPVEEIGLDELAAWDGESGAESVGFTVSDESDAIVPLASGQPVAIFGVNFDATDERDRVAILSAEALDYEVFTPESETVVLSLKNAIITPEAEGRIERATGGPTSLITAFQQPDVDNEVRIVVTRAPDLEPTITRRGKILFVDFQNMGVAAAEAPAFKSEYADAPKSSLGKAVDAWTAPAGEAAVPLAGEKAASAAADSGAGETALAGASKDAASKQSEFGGPASLDTEWVPAELPDDSSSIAALTEPAATPAPVSAPASLEPPAAVEILQEGGLIDGKEYRGRRISLDFKNVGVADVLRLIAEVSDLNIIAGQEVDGTVTIRLVDVPWDQALDVILLTKGLGFVRVGNVLRIAPADVLKVEEEVRLQERRNREKLEDLEVKLIPVNYASAGDVVGMVTRLLTARGSVDVDARTNTVIMKDIGSVIDEATALIQAVDTETPQVVIEAKIVEAALDFRRELGSTWGIQSNQYQDGATMTGVRTLGGDNVRFINENSLSFSNPISSAATGLLNLNALILDDDFNVDVSLQAAESSGDGKVISSPRVVTLDNRKAKISQGVSIPFQTFEGGDAKLEFVDAVLSLEVTPHITANKAVIMQVQVKRNAPDDSVATPTGSPAIAKNEAETETLVKDGQTMVIGGIYTIVKSERMTRVPYLYKIPIIGVAFRNMSVTDTRKELLVFITPRIVL